MDQRTGQPDRGFTLLELVISMAILSLIVVFAAGALSLGARSVAQGDSKMEGLERLRMGLSTFRAQIESQVPLRVEEEGIGMRYAFKGDAKTLEFATGYSAWGTDQGPFMVSYRVEETAAGRQALRVSESVYRTEAKREMLILEASEITFDYEQPAAADPATPWGDSWTNPDTIPTRVRLHLADGKRSNVLTISTRSQGVLTPGATGTVVRDTPRRPPI
jgi:prepilin-type N-terminal cleavage/methylation domain-containing protein